MLADVARAVSAAGHEVIVLTPTSLHGSDADHVCDAAEPFRVVRSRLWRKLHRMGGSPNAVLSRISRASLVPFIFWRSILLSRADLVIAGHVLPLGNIGAALKRLRGIPLMVMTYGEDVSVYARGRRMGALLRQALASADAITCLTTDSREEMSGLDTSLADRIHVIPPAVNIAVASVEAREVEAVRRRYQLEGKRVVLSVGRLVPRKGVDVTLAALSLLVSEFPDLMYVVVGEGPYRATLEQLADRLGVRPRVVFTGEVPSAHPFFHIGEVFVMPNRVMPSGEREGFGIVFLEAGLAGRPSIAGRSGGAPDAVLDGQTGLLVDPENPQEVASAIRRLLNNPDEAAKMGHAACSRALEKFSPESVGARFCKAIEGLLSGPHQSA